MIGRLLRFSSRVSSLRILALLSFVFSLLLLRHDRPLADSDPWTAVLTFALVIWVIWVYFSTQAGAGWTLRHRASAFMETLPVPARDLWFVSVFTAWMEIVLPAAIFLGVAVLRKPALQGEAPGYFLHYALAAVFPVLLYPIGSFHLTHTPNSWGSIVLAIAGLVTFFVTALLHSVLASGPLALVSLGLGLWTWRRMPPSFSRPVSEQAKRPGAPTFRNKLRDLWPGGQNSFVFRLHGTALPLAMLFYLPAIGFAFPWFGASHLFLGMCAMAMGIPSFRFLRVWLALAHLPLAPSRFLFLHTAPIWALFAVGYAVGTFVHGEVVEGAARQGFLLLLLAIFYTQLTALPLGRLRNRRLPEGTFTLLGGTPLQLLRNLLTIALYIAFGWVLIYRSDALTDLWERWVTAASQAIPFGAAGAWTLLAGCIPLCWTFLNRRFRRFDLGAGIRL